MDQAEVENRLAQLQVEIEQLRRQLDSARAEHSSEQAKLRELDLQIQTTSLKLRELDQQRSVHLQELAELQEQRNDYLQSLRLRQDELAVQVNAAYRIGSQSRLKLVLNQDSPARLSRMMAYYEYINRAQMRRIDGLRDALSTLDRLQSEIDRELSRLNEVTAAQREALGQLDEQRENREAVLSALASTINSEESRLQELVRNQQDLEALLERLTDVLADIPADLGQHLGVAAQRGALPLPVKGRVRHAFGQKRAGGLRWQGWLIAADAGTEVAAIAYGRVAFADWLRGYGLLLIIDHGDGFMSLYGNNESLLTDVGEWIEPGEIISVLGNNQATGQGLYFELRRNGKALDPASWLAR
jgi:septal ring factor EnvC (AmiA/AmiB activator)